MKFVSKNMNLRVVLRHGVPSEPMSGRNAVPGLYVKFEGGAAEVKDLETYNLMIKHPGFNSDYILVEDAGSDPFKDFRTEKEPQHNITEMTYGQIGKQLGDKVKMTRDQKKALRPLAEEMAKEMFKEMAPELMQEMLKKIVEKKSEENVPQEENAPAVEPTIPEFIEPTDILSTPPEFIESDETIADSSSVVDELISDSKPAAEKKQTTKKTTRRKTKK